MVTAAWLVSACGTIGFGKFRKETKPPPVETEDRPLEMPPPLVLTREAPTASAQPPPPVVSPSPRSRRDPQPGDWNARGPAPAGAAPADPIPAPDAAGAGGGESIVVTGQIADVHQQVRAFWGSLGVALARDDVSGGVVTTGWIAGYSDILAGRPAGGERDEIRLDRFSVSLTPGPEPDTTTVLLRHEGMRDRTTAETTESAWEVASDPRLEQITLERLRAFLGA